MRRGSESVLLFGEDDLLPLLSTSRKEPGHDFFHRDQASLVFLLSITLFPAVLGFRLLHLELSLALLQLFLLLTGIDLLFFLSLFMLQPQRFLSVSGNTSLLHFA